MIGSSEVSVSVRPILNLHPLDMLGINFIRLISPVSDLRHRYIETLIDYFIWWLWVEVSIDFDGDTDIRII